MATTVYETGTITLIDGTMIEISPLKIKYLREFMNIFEAVRIAADDEEAIRWLVECARVAMRQFYPEIQTTEDVENRIDLPTIYELIDICAGIKLNADTKEESFNPSDEDSDSSWEYLDLAKLESEIFLLGIWKNYEQLETEMSMPEIIITIEANRDANQQERKFLAAIQGVELEDPEEKPDAWEALKAKVFSNGITTDPKDVLALQGQAAVNAGFGIGMGLSYETWD